MADTQTTNYGLYKIGSANDTVGTHMPDHYNANQDAVDAALAENASNITSHTGNSTIHVTAAQKSTWNAKAPTASPTFTGTPAAPTAAAGTNTTQIATTAFVQTAVSGKANTASPALTGTPTAPTAAAGTDTTQIATTAFVHTDLANAVAKEIISVALGSQTGTGSSVTWSKTNAAITADHVVLAYELGTPAAQTGTLTWTTNAEAISVSGNINGTTTLTVILGIVGTSVT